MAEKCKLKYFCEQNYKWIKNPDGTACLKGWIKIRITLLPQPAADKILQKCRYYVGIFFPKCE